MSVSLPGTSALYGCGQLTEFCDVIGWENSLGGSGLTMGNPSWTTLDFNHCFGLRRIWFLLNCFPQKANPGRIATKSSTADYQARNFQNIRAQSLIETEITRVRTDHQMNFPTDVTKAITCLLLHACAQKVRILRPLGEAWDFPRRAVGFQLDELAGGISSCRISWTTQPDLS